MRLLIDFLSKCLFFVWFVCRCAPNRKPFIIFPAVLPRILPRRVAGKLHTYTNKCVCWLALCQNVCFYFFLWFVCRLGRNHKPLIIFPARPPRNLLSAAAGILHTYEHTWFGHTLFWWNILCLNFFFVFSLICMSFRPTPHPPEPRIYFFQPRRLSQAQPQVQNYTQAHTRTGN